MDFDTVKENIQPLRQGRNAERLEIALNAENQQALQKELEQQRHELELAIEHYEGEDPLETWYDYISWIEQSYPKSGKESHLDDVLIKCITTFENDSRYKQDRRMVKVYMKYIDNQDNPQNFYEELYNQGVGTMVADLYIGWAYYYDAADNFKKAEEIYRKGLDARAQPFEDLNHAHKHFCFSMSQRILYKDEPSNQQEFRSFLVERRSALTSLRAHKKRYVGTTRTGLAVKNDHPGLVQQAGPSRHVDENNVTVQVYKEDEQPNNTTVPRNESIVKSLVDNARARENKHEPGPWNKAKLGSKDGPLIPKPKTLGFQIMEDDASFTPIPYTEKTYHLGFLPPPNFVSKNGLLPSGWDSVPNIIPEPVNPNSLPMYSKMYCYPSNSNEEYSAQESHAYKWFKSRNISNKFTLKHDPIWDNKYECGIRLYPNFVSKNLQQPEMEYIEEMQLDVEKGFMFNYEALKIIENSTMKEKSNEELMAERWRLNPKRYTEQMDVDDDVLEETVIGDRRVSVMPRYSTMAGRKSVFPERATTTTEQMANKDFKVPQMNLRKSVLPRKSVIPAAALLPPILDDSETFEDSFQIKVNEINQVSENTPATGFQIYEDNTNTTKSSEHKRKISMPSEEATASKNVCTNETPLKFRTSMTSTDDKFDDFVAPKPKSPVKSMLSFPIFEDEPVKNDDEIPASSQIFSHNDSMCTMNFNQCLDKESASTPIQNKTAKRVEFIEKMQQSEEGDNSPVISASDAENIEPPMYAYQTLPKQLSTIMEITETTSSTASCVNTKSSISSPESDNDTALKQKSMVVNSDEIPTSDTVAQPTPLRLENASVCSKEKTLVIPAFSIYEDKTENMKAITLKDPTFIMQNLSKIDKENNSKILSPASQLESFKLPETVGFANCEDDKDAIPLDSMNSMMSLRLVDEPSTQETQNNFKSESRKASRASFTDKIDTQEAISGPSKSVFAVYEDDKLPSPMNSMVAFEIPEISESNSNRMKNEFEIYEDEHTLKASESVKLSSLKANSKQSIAMDKTDETLKPTEDRSKPLVLFNLSMNKTSEATADASTKPHTSVRRSDEFYDFFAKSPVKPGRPALFAKLDMSPKSKELSSLLKFDTSERDATQALVRLNLNDTKNVSLLAKAPTTNTPLLTPSQIKQEKSLHLQDSLTNSRKSTFSPVYAMTPEKAANENKRPIFVEDDNINTINFASNLGSIQNSTLIAPELGGIEILNVEGGVRMSTINENELSDKLHRKNDDSFQINGTSFKPKVAVETPTLSKTPIIPKPSAELMPPPIFKPIAVPSVKENHQNVHSNEANDLRMSIYVNSEKSIEDVPEQWEEVLENFNVNSNGNNYLPHVVDLNATQIVIDERLQEDVFNPFDKNLLNALLDKVDFLNFLETHESSCTLRNKISPLAKGQLVTCGTDTFEVLKTIGKGGYGTIFCGKSQNNGKLYALKQERPTNLWEYYICLELSSRINNPNILHGFMKIDCALIGNNASVLVSEFSKYGTLLDVCNKIKKSTNRNMDELIVMIFACQILDLIDHLHGSHIIHADIKPDNFLVMSKLDHRGVRPAIQLIDFGVSIDMVLIDDIQPDVQFKLISEDDPCIEMRENKPWTYQVDLYGVAGTVHAILFGKYMEVEKKIHKWDIKTKLPRYFQKDIWEHFFNTLLNIRSSKEMPNLQGLKVTFKEELENKGRTVREKIQEFNQLLESN